MSYFQQRFSLIAATGVVAAALIAAAPSVAAVTAPDPPTSIAAPFAGTGVESLLADGRFSAIMIAARSSRKKAHQSDSAEKSGGQDKTKPSEPAPPAAAADPKAVEKAETSSPSPTGAASQSGQGQADTAAILKQAAALAKDGDYQAALAAYESALSSARDHKDLKTAAASLSAMARMCRRLDRDDEALEHLKKSVELHHETKNARARSLDHLLIARILAGQSKWQQAAAAFEEGLKILPDSEASERPPALEELAACMLRLDQRSEALQTYGRLLSVWQKEGNKLGAARTLMTIGEAQVSNSDPHAARISFKKAESLFREAGDKKGIAEAIFRLAYLDQTAGNYKAAQEAIEAGQGVVANEPGSETNALPQFVRGMNAYAAGKAVEASGYFTSALGLYEKQGDRLMAARVRLALANAENDRARAKAALEQSGRALREFRALSDPTGEAGALLVVSEVYVRQGFVQKALEYAQESLAVAKKANDKKAIIQARVLLAQIHLSLGDIDFAGKLLKESVEDVPGVPNRRIRGEVRLAVARFRLSRENLDDALQTVQAAYNDFQEVNDRRGVGDCDHLAGLAYELKGESGKAEEMLQKALSVRRAMWDRYGEGADLAALGVHYKNAGDMDKAMSHFQQALELRRSIGDLRGEAATLANIGNLERHKGDAVDAVRKLETALEAYRQLGDKKGEADVLANLGNAHAAARMHQQALEKINAAIEIHRRIHDPRGLATDLVSLGRLNLDRGDLENARSNLEEAEKVNKRIINPRGDLTILSELATLRQSEKNTKQALNLLERALKIARDIGDLRAVAAIQLKTAAVLRDAGNYGRGLTLLGDALEIMKGRNDRVGELFALAELGMVQVRTEDYENALTNLHRAAELRSELGLPQTHSQEIDYHLGEIYEGFKDFDRALEHYHKALAIAQVTGAASLLGRIHHRIGYVYCQLDEYPKAKDALEEALRVHSETKNIQMQKAELIRLGDVLARLGDTEEALKYQVRALSLTKDSGDAATEARILTRMGTLYQLLGRPRIALEHYADAQQKHSDLGDRRGVNQNLLQIALVTSMLGNFDNAVDNLKKAFSIAQCSEDRSTLWKAYFIMGRALEGKNRLGEALESYRKAITIVDAMEADISEESDEDNFVFGGKTALFETTLRVLMTLARKDPEGAYDHQALTIVEQLKAADFEKKLSRVNVESFSNMPKDMLIKEKSVKLGVRRINERLAAELSKVNPDQDGIKKLLDERRVREANFAKLRGRIAQDYPEYAALRYPKHLSVHRLQKETIDPEEAVLAYMVTRSRTYLFCIDKNRFSTYSIEYPQEELERDIHALLKPLYRSDAQENWDPSIAFRLYSKMVKPAEYFFSNKKTVVVIPHGPLELFPLEMLVCSPAHGGKKFWSQKDRPTHLIEKHAFAYLPSLSLLSMLRSREKTSAPGWDLVAFGPPLYTTLDAKSELNAGADRLLAALDHGAGRTRNDAARGLPPTGNEIPEIAKIMEGPVQTYSGAQATETLFKKADLGRYAYIHLAAHGLILGATGKLGQQPAIAFSLYGDEENDGFLQLGEIFGLRLNADLVVVSSMHAGGTGEAMIPVGLAGLVRGLIFAGAESAILSVWPGGRDQSTALFTEMYRDLRDGSKAEALRRAKLTLLQSPATSHPYYWAPCVLMGEWRVKHTPGQNKVDPGPIRFRGLSAWRKLFSR
jgi:tetratricopeptide (TPR) repeat protein